MRSRSYLLLSIPLCLAGAALQCWSLATGYEPGTGLPIAGAPALTALTVFAVAVPVLALLLSLPLRGGRTARPEGLYAGIPLPGSLLGALSGGLTAAAGVLLLLRDLPAALNRPQILDIGVCAVDLLLVLGGGSMVWMALSARKEGRTAGHSLAALLPGFAGCFRLVIFYHNHSRDPVVAHYCWMLLALMAAILALYYQAGFSFDHPRPLRAMTCTMTAAIYAFTALPASESLADALLLAGLGLWMLLNIPLLLRTGQTRGRREMRAAPPAATEAETE